MAQLLMLYYSLDGNTEFVAKEVAKDPRVTVERLRPAKEPPKSGFGKILVGGRSALFRENPHLAPVQANPADYQAILLGFPIWAGTYPPAIGAMLKACDLRGKELYLMICSASGKTEKAVAHLRAALPDSPIRGTLSLIQPLQRQSETAAQLQEYLASIHLAG